MPNLCKALWRFLLARPRPQKAGTTRPRAELNPMQTLLCLASRLGLLCLLSLATSLSPQSHADSGPPAPALAAPVHSPAWAVLDPLTRLLPIDAYAGPMGRPLALAGGRNEVADGQIALFAGEQPWRNVTVKFSQLKGPEGAAIAGSLMRARRVGSVRTQMPGYQTRYVGLWPDPLLPLAPFDIAAQARAFVWVDLAIPSNAKPGLYTGRVTVSSLGSAALTIPVSLRVWNWAMPRQSHIRTAFGTGFYGNRAINDGAVKDDLLAHRLTPTECVGRPRVVAPAQPGGPQTYNWADFDQSMIHRLAQGMTGFAINFPDQNPDIARAYQEHLSRKGWLPYAYVYAADEPNADQLPALNQKLADYKRAAPGIPLLVTARGYPQALTNVDIWCPCIIAGRGDYFQPDASHREQQRGKASWWYPAYPSRAPGINLWTDYPLLDERLWPWLSWKHDMDGMLYWAVTNWRDTPNPLADAARFLDSNGDGELLYPDAQGKPIDSLRLECLRDGMQDYEVFCLLEAGARELAAQGKAPALAKQARALCAIDNALVTDYAHFSTDPHALLSTRTRMSLVLEQITKQLGHDPKIVGRPRYQAALPLRAAP